MVAGGNTGDGGVDHVDEPAEHDRVFIKNTSHTEPQFKRGTQNDTSRIPRISVEVKKGWMK